MPISGVNFRPMLHALLHGKLEHSVPEPDRLEDALTSSVFGTLVLVESWDVLARWLRVPSELLPQIEQLPMYECWFWPRLAFAEPDAVLRIGSALFVIEAKYRSGRHDLEAPDDERDRVTDQLVRQYQSVIHPLSSRIRYAEELERAIADCRLIQVLVVDARQRRARREWKESKERLPHNAVLEMITWQELFRILNADKASRWSSDLRAYLCNCGLDTFDGISCTITPQEHFDLLLHWTPQFNVAFPCLNSAVSLTLQEARSLKEWRGAACQSKGSSWALPRAVINGDTQRILTTWHLGPRR